MDLDKIKALFGEQISVEQENARRAMFPQEREEAYTRVNALRDMYGILFEGETPPASKLPLKPIPVTSGDPIIKRTHAEYVTFYNNLAEALFRPTLSDFERVALCINYMEELRKNLASL